MLLWRCRFSTLTRSSRKSSSKAWSFFGSLKEHKLWIRDANTFGSLPGAGF
jgi:hypothetical protein